MRKQKRVGIAMALLLVVGGCSTIVGMDVPILDPSWACGNGILDGNETDVNCGGGDCEPCDTGKTCRLSGDCKSKICKAGACEPSRCDDDVSNGDEGDVDCGGVCERRCADGDTCNVGGDCSSQVCTDGVCQVPRCGDGVVQSVIGEECEAGDLIDDHCGVSCLVQKVVKIAAGYFYTCALLHDGRVKCWGDNVHGELGLGDKDDRGDGPGEMGDALGLVNLSSVETAGVIAAGTTHACVLLNDGSVKCWGFNGGGQLGQGDTNDRGDILGEMGDALSVVNLGSGKTATAIAVGGAHNCAFVNDGSVKCWGYDNYGQLGLGDTNPRGDGAGEVGDDLAPLNLGTGKAILFITAGKNHTCALLNGGSVKCWGFNKSGQLGLGDTNDRGDEPGEMGDALPLLDLGTGKTATAISAGAYHTCVLLDDGSVKCWGYNGAGQLGLGDLDWRGDGPGEMGDALPTVNLGTGKTAAAIAAGASHTCVLLNDGSVKCWGYNDYGQLGLGNQNERGDGPGEMGDALPTVNLGTGKTATAIAAGYAHTCALLNDGSVKCWGRNDSGQLGLGDTDDRGDGPNEMGDALPAVKLFSDVW